jgi:hypothetical protein
MAEQQKLRGDVGAGSAMYYNFVLKTLRTSDGCWHHVAALGNW